MKQSEFRFPVFDKRKNVEFRFEEDVVCIYGTPEGLRMLAKKMIDLADHPGQGHIHLEYGVEPSVTKQSADAAVAVFPLNPESK